ncbi:hypothetical protein EV383_0677 [Pseudonocardia sediminis]|uniref:AhpC/TSA family protein n=1 Tax=Pseudonocardia sediminis TaxID=1397368 RepID=A0A4Q7USQ1_PSEST|nr:AhpC/TSA family protein [Pseudonocardia sediminis]RZT83858.1 hypothetical protein EV383_0677 [Pseudonocardia sediminis]
MQERLDGTGIGMVTVGFSPPEALAALAGHLGLRGPVLSDEHRDVYRLLGFRRAPILAVYSPGTLLYYARRRLRGHPLPRPVEDTRQMGGDAVTRDATIVRRFAPSSPDDRVTPARLVDAALRVRGRF